MEIVINNIKSKYIEYFISPDLDGKRVKANRIKSNRRSNLFLLRRNLTELYGPEIDVQTKIKEIKAPLLIATGILSGLEILSKIYSGCENSKIQSFDFLNKESKNTNTSKILSNLRHGLVHKQSLINIVKQGKEKDTKYIFTLTDEPDYKVLETLESKKYIVSIYYLKKIFLDSIEFVSNKVYNEKEYQKNFDAVEEKEFFWIEIN